MIPFLLTLGGFFVGGCGTMIGIGGGLFIAPALAFWRPEETAERIAALSLLVVFCNATSGAIAYARKGLVHFKSGLYFSATAIPGSILGTIVAGMMARSAFNIALGSFLILMSGVLMWRTLRKPPQDHHPEWTGPTLSQMHIGAAVSAGVGFLASILGIGGGIIHVPLLAFALHYPVHRATATSHFVLAITAGVSSTVYVAQGKLDGNWDLALPLVIGVVLGAQVGARLAKHIKPKWIILILSILIAVVGTKLAYPSLKPASNAAPTSAPESTKVTP